MTGKQLVDMWQIMSGKTIARSTIVNLLNLAMHKTAKMVHRHYTPNLDNSNTTATLDSDGKYALTSLSPTIWELHNGIDFIRPHQSTTIVYRRISFEEYQRSLEQGITFDASRPKYYCRGNYIYSLPFTNGDTIDIYYRAEPTAIADNTTASTFSTRIQDIIIRMACMGVNDGMYKSALDDIRELNETRPPTDSNFMQEDPLALVDPTQWGYLRPIRMVGDVETVQGLGNETDPVVWQG